MMPLLCAAASADAACLLKANHFVGTQRSSCLCQILLQRLAVQQLHDQIRPPILLTGVEDGADVGMA
jgi:hypothetical protein